jgi:rsbT co-antagonist protein RsbR
MTQTGTAVLADILRRDQSAVLNEWLRLQVESVATRRDLMSEGELHQQSREFLAAFATALGTGERYTPDSPIWAPSREVLARISESRARQGFTPTETASFVFSLKEPLFNRLRTASTDPMTLANQVWTISLLLDALGLLTTELHQKSREGVILRQQQEMLELSTPVVTLWEGVLALPLIGTLDSARTQVVMENLLQRIVDSGSSIAILDITGVPTVDTLVAQHLLKTVAAARLMGADCIISGIRPQIAQTIVHLGVDLNAVTTKATLADAFDTALKRLSLTIVKTAPTSQQQSAPAAKAVNGQVR